MSKIKDVSELFVKGLGSLARRLRGTADDVVPHVDELLPKAVNGGSDIARPNLLNSVVKSGADAVPDLAGKTPLKPKLTMPAMPANPMDDAMANVAQRLDDAAKKGNGAGMATKVDDAGKTTADVATKTEKVAARVGDAAASEKGMIRRWLGSSPTRGGMITMAALGVSIPWIYGYIDRKSGGAVSMTVLDKTISGLKAGYNTLTEAMTIEDKQRWLANRIHESQAVYEFFNNNTLWLAGLNLAVKTTMNKPGATPQDGKNAAIVYQFSAPAVFVIKSQIRMLVLDEIYKDQPEAFRDKLIAQGLVLDLIKDTRCSELGQHEVTEQDIVAVIKQNPHGMAGYISPRLRSGLIQLYPDLKAVFDQVPVQNVSKYVDQGPALLDGELAEPGNTPPRIQAVVVNAPEKTVKLVESGANKVREKAEKTVGKVKDISSRAFQDGLARWADSIDIPIIGSILRFLVSAVIFLWDLFTGDDDRSKEPKNGNSAVATAERKPETAKTGRMPGSQPENRNETNFAYNSSADTRAGKQKLVGQVGDSAPIVALSQAFGRTQEMRTLSRNEDLPVLSMRSPLRMEYAA